MIIYTIAIIFTIFIILLSLYPLLTSGEKRGLNISHFGVISVAVILGSGLIYAQVGSLHAQIQLDNINQSLPKFFARLNDPNAPDFTTQELEIFASSLNQDLIKNPNNVENWWLLGQIAARLNNATLTMQSFEKAYKLQPQNTEYKLGYAQMLLLSNDQISRVEGGQLLKEVLKQDHSNIKALTMLGFSYFDEQNYDMAISTFSLILKLLDPNDPKFTMIVKTIQTIEREQHPKSLKN